MEPAWSALSYFSSFTYSFSFLITFWQKWLLLANSFSTSLWIWTSLLRVSICDFIEPFLAISCSVCFDWYSSSVVNWWFYRIVNLVVVWSYSSFNANRLAFVSLILCNISFLRLSVALIFSLSSSLTCCYLSFFSFFKSLSSESLKLIISSLSFSNSYKFIKLCFMSSILLVTSYIYLLWVSYTTSASILFFFSISMI